MNTPALNDRYGRLVEPTTLRLQRLLPGPIERVWAYLSDGELRRQWLAAGTMDLQPGASFELVWRNDELSDADDPRPEGFGAEHRATCRFIGVAPPRLMRYLWPQVGEVCIELEPQGRGVLLTLTHRRLGGASRLLSVSAGWHAHLMRLQALAEGRTPPSLWRHWKQLRQDYAAQLGLPLPA